MPRILGVDIPSNRQVWISLQSLYGIGRHTAELVCKELGLDPTRKAHTLSADEITQITSLIESRFPAEGVLRRQVTQDINRLRDIKCYRGARHRAGLPLRGQRTRTNARTRKGPRKTIAGKKIAVK